MTNTKRKSAFYLYLHLCETRLKFIIVLFTVLSIGKKEDEKKMIFLFNNEQV